jgi:serine/threonine-protein kinase
MATARQKPPQRLAAVPSGTLPKGQHVEFAHTYRQGDVIAEKYQLQSVIGKGGMGSIWRARNLVLHVDVAIKLINRGVASAEASTRLLVEARAAAQLDHPSIVRVHDFGTTDFQDPYIVMELLEGESLADVLDRKGSLTAQAAVQLALPLLGALAAAHGKGIVHRDIKPDNVILTTTEEGTVIPKLVDFGIAKVEGAPIVIDPDRDEDASELEGRVATRLTQVGRLMGSPDYMSPEQARGDEADEGTDIWALAVVLYESIVGDVPFSGPTVERVLARIMMDDPTPITAFAVGDPTLWAAISQGLRKRVRERWQSAREMGKALAAWLLSQGIDTDITGASIRQHWLGQRARPFSMPPPADPGAEEDPLGHKITPVDLRKISDGTAKRPVTGEHTQPGLSSTADDGDLMVRPRNRLRRFAVAGGLTLAAAGVGAIWRVQTTQEPTAAVPSATVETAAPTAEPTPPTGSTAPAPTAEPTASATESTKVASPSGPPGTVRRPVSPKGPKTPSTKATAATDGPPPLPDLPNY